MRSSCLLCVDIKEVSGARGNICPQRQWRTRTTWTYHSREGEATAAEGKKTQRARNVLKLFFFGPARHGRLSISTRQITRHYPPSRIPISARLAPVELAGRRPLNPKATVLASTRIPSTYWANLCCVPSFLLLDIHIVAARLLRSAWALRKPLNARPSRCHCPTEILLLLRLFSHRKHSLLTQLR